ncbi:rab-GTPase-TBC domain-containing protein [Schizophyllum amplum]|uniref:Rab-GTPase-TBC domain-containing protein n=1 Tax=Schizophyllum amplum TaxID=97359 RepID=A0A550CYU9_9AGAR|nr:rab-GTPase-TBC domain-containing protein [Auriculariopsis ampla]
MENSTTPSTTPIPVKDPIDEPPVDDLKSPDETDRKEGGSARNSVRKSNDSTTPTTTTAKDVDDVISLEELKSPHDPEFSKDAAFPRDSIRDSELTEVTLEGSEGSQEDFSPVALSSRNSASSSISSFARAAGTRLSTSSIASPVTLIDSKPSSHKKTSSTTTILSAHNMVLDDTPRANRQSIDGQLKLQEDFERLHKDKEAEAAEGAAQAIDWNFWGDVMGDYTKFAAEHPEELSRAIAKGIPSALRGMMWQLMAASKDPELESTYLKLLKESSTPHEKAITRDLGRTFPHHAFFTDGQGIGQENLFNVLKAYSLYDTSVGYCQGLPFVVAILLLNMPDEEAFSLLVRLMQDYGLRGHFLPEMPKLQLRLFQFDRLIEELLPVLHVHFLRQGVKSSMFCSQWFLTMFSYRFPLDVVFRIYDHVLANGIEAIFGFSIALLHRNEETLLKMKFDEILGFLNMKLFEVYKVDSAEGEQPTYKVDEFVQDAVSLRISSFMLDSYAHEYEEMLRETNKDAIEKDELRSTNRMLAAKVKDLENNLAQLNTEHVEILNELVKQRLRNEEMEEQLVRYKLLYAEAMHQNEDAGSSHRLSQATTSSGKASNSKRGSSKT